MTPMRRVARALAFAAWGCLAAMALHAQEFRDPTTPPPEASALPGSAAGAAPAPGMAVVVRDGKPHLVVGTRLVPVGQKVGNAKLERITETEVWLREGKQLNKLPRFSGIQRSVAKPVVPCAAPSAKARTRSKSVVTPAAPCEGVQP